MAGASKQLMLQLIARLLGWQGTPESMRNMRKEDLVLLMAAIRRLSQERS